MDGRERKEEEEETSLPPDYVSFARLKEQWLQKQQEGKQKKNQEEEKKERESKNDGHEKIGGGFVRDAVRRRVQKSGGERGVIDGKGKGKEMAMGGFENGEENKRKYMTMNKRHLTEKKSAGVEGEGKGKGKVRIESEFEGGDGCEGVEIVQGNEVRGRKEIARVSMVEVLPGDGVKGEISSLRRIRGGFGRRDDRDSRNKSNRGYGVSNNELKMEDGKGYDKQWREKGRNAGYRERYNRLESRSDVLKGNEVELESEEKAGDDILEVFSERWGFDGKDKNGVGGQGNNGRNKMKDHRVEVEGLNDNGEALVESVKNGEKGVGKGYSRGRLRRSDRLKESRPDVLTGNEVELESEKKAEDEILDVFSEKCGFNGKPLVESAKNGEKGVGKGYSRGHLRRNDRLKESRPDVLKGNEVKLESEKKAEDEILEVFSEKCGFNEKDENGVGGQNNYGRNKMKEDRVEGEDLNDNGVALVEKVDHEIFLVESAKNGEKGGVRMGYRRYGHLRRNVGKDFGGSTFNDHRPYNLRSRVGDSGGGRREFRRNGVFYDHRKMNQRESGLRWVKKEEKSGIDAAEVGSSGISVDQE